MAQFYKRIKKIFISFLVIICYMMNIDISVYVAMKQVSITVIKGYGYKAHGSNYGSGATSRYDANFEYITVDGYGVVTCIITNGRQRLLLHPIMQI